MAIDPRGKAYLDAPSSETDETRRERFADLPRRIREECDWVEMALDSNHTDGIDNHFEEIHGWARAALDEIEDAPDVKS
jgi:hypothetical protein